MPKTPEMTSALPWSKGGFPLFAETTRSELASTRWLAEQFLAIV